MLEDKIAILNVEGENLSTAKAVFKEVDAIYKCIQVYIYGQVDSYNSTQFQHVINDAIALGYTHIIFECSHLVYLSSTGVGSFTSILKAVRDKNGRMIICNLQPKVKEVIDLLGFSSFFDLASSMADAMAILIPHESVSKPTTESMILENPITHQAVFPIVFECPFCAKKFKIAKAGRYRCNKCHSSFAVHEDGK